MNWRALALIVLSTAAAFAQTRSGTDGYIPTAAAPGASDSSYQLSNLFSLNYYSGNLHLDIPLLKSGGRGEAEARFGVTWDGSKSIIDDYGVSAQCSNGANQPCHMYNVSAGVAGVYSSGGSLSVRQADNVITGVVTNAWAVTRLSFSSGGSRELPQGSQVELVDSVFYGQPVLTQCNLFSSGYTDACQHMANRGRTFVSHDGSQIVFVSDVDIKDQVSFGANFTPSVSGVLYWPNGTKYRIDSDFVTSMTDRNGNVVKTDFSSVTNSLGRTITEVATDNPDSFHRQIALNYHGFQGSPRSIFVQTARFSELIVAGSFLAPRDLYGELYGQVKQT